MVACKQDPETTADYLIERGFLGYLRTISFSIRA
jgi:hypothetical protein